MQQKHYIFIGVIILAALAGIFSYPNYFNKGIDYLNEKLSWTLPHFIDKPYILGLDLQGGVSLTYQADLNLIGKESKKEVMEMLKDRIEQRVNSYGVAEPVIQIQGEDRLIVDLAGVKDINEAIQMIGETPYIEFLEQKTEEETQQILDKIKEIEGKTLEEMQKIKDWQTAFQNPYFKSTELTGKYLKVNGTKVILDQITLKPIIELEFDDEGAKLFEKITGRNIGKRLAIFLNDNSIIDMTGDGKIDKQDFYNPYAPVVQDKISGGKAQITGDIKIDEAKKIASRLKDGALPVKIGTPISQRSVGPILGQIALEESLRASIFGFLGILAYMTIFYRLKGLLASFSLGVYIVFALSLFKLLSMVPFISFTFTLAGIAGFLLSMGMAVDANILIFARMREELKAGRGYLSSLEEGIKRAWPSVRDGNFTTILVGLVLFIFGTSFVKGFALTLIIGNFVGMFTAIFITTYLIRIFLGNKEPKQLWLWG